MSEQDYWNNGSTYEKIADAASRPAVNKPAYIEEDQKERIKCL